MKTLNTAELNDDDAENASNAEVAEFIVAQHESRKEHETSMNNANHHHESGDCNNNNINKLEEQGLEQPSSPTSLTFKHHKIPREQWNNKIEYMLSVIGYVVDLGNCVRFPYVTYKNGGGAFLIPYFVFLLLIGVPMMYLEMSIGQYCKVGNIKLWEKVNVYMKGSDIEIFFINLKVLELKRVKMSRNRICIIAMCMLHNTLLRHNHSLFSLLPLCFILGCIAVVDVR